MVEDVMAVVEKEKPVGVICQFGGQTAINLAAPLAKRGVTVLGTSVDGMDRQKTGTFDESPGQIEHSSSRRPHCYQR